MGNSLNCAVDDRIDDIESLAVQTNSKFMMTEDASEAEFGVLDDFYEGATTRLGYPNPNFMEGMEKEHCARGNALDYFQTPNYKVTTCPRIEWQWVFDPKDHIPWGKYPGETGDSVAEICTSIEFESNALTSTDLQILETTAPFHSALRSELFRSCFGESKDILTELKPMKISIVFIPSTTWAAYDQSIDRLIEVALKATFRSISAVYEIASCEGRWTNSIDLPKERTTSFEIKTGSDSSGDAAGQLFCSVLKDFNENLMQCCFGKGLRTVRDLDARKVDVHLTVEATLCDAIVEAAIVEAFTKASGLNSVAKVTSKITKYIYSRQHTKAATHLKDYDDDVIMMTGRDRVGCIKDFMQIDKVIEIIQRARISVQEVLALRLYTGPMYLIYNAKLRGSPADIIDQIGDNRYETTLFVLISAISNLSKVTDIPKDRVLYRGLGGKLLSQDFWKKSEGCQVHINIKRKQATSDIVTSINLVKIGQGLKLEVEKKEWREATIVCLKADLSLKDPVSISLEKMVVTVKITYEIVTLVISLRDISKFSLLSETVDRNPFTETKQLVRRSLAQESEVENLDIVAERISDKPKDFQGGIELGMLSTTLDRSVAIEYSGVDEKRAIVLEIEAGRIDLGASLSFVSQYPAEEEFLMPPLTCLEVRLTGNLCLRKSIELFYVQVKNPIKVGKDSEGNEIVFVPVRANVNLKSMTIEEFSGQKRRMHLSSFALMIEEVRLQLNKMIEKDRVQQKWRNENPGRRFSLDKLVDKIVQDCEAKKSKHEEGTNDKYKKEYFYRERVNEMLEMKTMALSKLKLWTKNDKERIPNIFNLQLREAHRKWVFFLQKKLEEAAEQCKTLQEKKKLGKTVTLQDEENHSKALENIKKIAIRICKCKGLFENSVDDVNDIGEVTLLNAAAEGESALTLKLLKLAGADINTGRSQNGKDMMNGCKTIQGADSSTPQDCQSAQIFLEKTAVMIAAENGHTNTVLILAELKADISAMVDGFTALMLAAMNGHTDTALKLCQLHADIHEVCQSGENRTSLMLAAEKGHSETVQVLFDFGAKLWNRQSNCSAICLAAQNGHIETVKLLYRLSLSQTKTVRNGLNDLLSVAQKGSITIFDRVLSMQTIENLFFNPVTLSNFGHVIDEIEDSKDKAVHTLKDLFHNVLKSHEFLQELKMAKEVVKDKVDAPGKNETSKGEDDDDAIMLRNVYGQIEEFLEKQIKDATQFELDNGDLPQGLTGSEASVEHEQDPFNDIVGYGLVGAYFILGYRGLLG